MLKNTKTRHGNARRGGKNREATFRTLMTRLRARTSLNAEEIQKLADFLSKLWREREMLFNNRISRARKMLDSMLADEVISAGDITTAANAQVISTGDITTPENEATEKGEKKIPPYNPPIRKDPKRNPPIARARTREDGKWSGLFAEFWDAYPKSCPRKVGRNKCRAKYAALMDKSEDPAALHAEMIAGLERWCRSQDWVEDNGKFIKAPLVWLNQENWKDSPSPYSLRSAATAIERAADERERMAKEQAAALRRNAVAALTERDWALCAESCANCTGRSCAKGHRLPCDHRLTQRPVPPSECPHFIAKEVAE